jgi:hypothetical protein
MKSGAGYLENNMTIVIVMIVLWEDMKIQGLAHTTTWTVFQGHLP